MQQQEGHGGVATQVAMDESAQVSDMGSITTYTQLLMVMQPCI